MDNYSKSNQRLAPDQASGSTTAQQSVDAAAKFALWIDDQLVTLEQRFDDFRTRESTLASIGRRASS